MNKGSYMVATFLYSYLSVLINYLVKIREFGILKSELIAKAVSDLKDSKPELPANSVDLY